MKSMTGFGRGERENDHMTITVELKSVNQRFLDCQFHMAKRINELESDMRQKIKTHLTRGRIDIYITLSPKVDMHKTTRIDWETIEQLIEELTSQSEKRFGFMPDKQRLLEHFITQEEFVTVTEEPLALEDYQTLLFEAVELALEQLVRNRELEGMRLKEILQVQHQQITKHCQAIAQHAEKLEQEQEMKLVNALTLRMDDFDETRVLTEVALLLERGDIHEELDRLAVHLTRLTELLEQTTPVGRELDFLIQEFNREVNTIGSKTALIEVKNHVVALKTTIEKMREQVQNIE